MGGGGGGGCAVVYRLLLAAVRIRKLFRVGVDCSVVEMDPVQRRSHKERVFVLLCVTVLAVKASVVGPYVGVSRIACAVVQAVSCTSCCWLTAISLSCMTK